MQILLTTILCKSGLSTHVWDLADSLTARGITVSIGLQTISDVNYEKYGPWLERINHLPYFFYKTNDELLYRTAQLQPNLVHAHSPLVFSSSVHAAIRSSVPLIITLHSPFPLEKWYPLTLLTARWIIAVGPIQKESVPSYSSKTVVIPNGIDLTRYQPKSSVPNSHLKLCWFGRVHGAAAEGITHLNQALHLVRRSGTALSAYFVGSGPDAAKDAFINIGWLNDPVSFLQETQVTFGHGRSLREAMACGSIGYLLGAGYGGRVTEEFIRTYQHLDAFPQYKLAPAKPELLAAHILELIDHPEMIPHLQKEARQMALQYFDLEDMTDSILSLYSETISRS